MVLVVYGLCTPGVNMSVCAAQVIAQMREKLRLHCAPVQLPLGLEDGHRGLVDLVAMRAFHFEGPNGETITQVGRGAVFFFLSGCL